MSTKKTNKFRLLLLALIAPVALFSVFAQADCIKDREKPGYTEDNLKDYKSLRCTQAQHKKDECQNSSKLLTEAAKKTQAAIVALCNPKISAAPTENQKASYDASTDIQGQASRLEAELKTKFLEAQKAAEESKKISLSALQKTQDAKAKELAQKFKDKDYSGVSQATYPAAQAQIDAAWNEISDKTIQDVDTRLAAMNLLNAEEIRLALSVNVKDVSHAKDAGNQAAQTSKKAASAMGAAAGAPSSAGKSEESGKKSGISGLGSSSVPKKNESGFSSSEDKKNSPVAENKTTSPIAKNAKAKSGWSSGLSVESSYVKKSAGVPKLGNAVIANRSPSSSSSGHGGSSFNESSGGKKDDHEFAGTSKKMNEAVSSFNKSLGDNPFNLSSMDAGAVMGDLMKDLAMPKMELGADGMEATNALKVLETGQLQQAANEVQGENSAPLFLRIKTGIERALKSGAISYGIRGNLK